MNLWKLPRLAIVVAVVSCLLWFVFALFFWDDSHELEPPVVWSDVEGLPAHSNPGGFQLEAARNPDSLRLEVAVTTDSNEPPTGFSRVILIGRAVDERNLPLAGVVVALHSLPGGAEQYDNTHLDALDEVSRRTAMSAFDGTFELEAPVPTRFSSVTFGLDEFHSPRRVKFGGDRLGGRRRLEAGVRDLGDILLITTGAIRGEVLDALGTPIEGANLSAGTPWRLYGRAVSGVAGEFVIGAVPPGTYQINASADRYLSRHVQQVEVRRMQVTEGIDFVLETAPMLRGRVVDGSGIGIEGALLQGSPALGGSVARAVSQTDGSFVMHLPQSEPYSLELTCSGFGPVVGGEGKYYPPGTDSLRFVMLADTSTTFVIVDQDMAPITHFGIRVLRNGGAKASPRRSTHHGDPPTPSHHPEGKVQARARPELDRYEIYAPGFKPAHGEVSHDADSSVQRVTLQRGTAILGRVTHEGVPVEGARVRAIPGYMRKASLAAGGECEVFLGRWLETRTIETGVDGVFRFTGVRQATYRLEAERAGAGVVLRVPVHSTGEADTDVGDLVLVPTARIAGRVLLPPGVFPGGLTVYLDRRSKGPDTVTDTEGRFFFDAVAPGPHVLDIDGVPGILADGDEFLIQILPGELCEPVLDIVERGVCTVRLTVTLAGRPAHKAEVLLRPIETPLERLRLGTVNEQGRVSGAVRAAGESRVLLYTDAHVLLEHPTARVHLLLGTEPKAVLDFDSASLEVVLPNGLNFPDNALLEFEFTLHDAQPFTLNLNFFGRVLTWPQQGAAIDGQRITINHLPIGSGECHFILVDGDRKGTTGDMPGGVHRIPPELEVTVPISLQSGKRTVLNLPH